MIPAGAALYWALPMLCGEDRPLALLAFSPSSLVGGLASSTRCWLGARASAAMTTGSWRTQSDRSGDPGGGVDDLCPENGSAKDDVAVKPAMSFLCHDSHYLAKCYVWTNDSTLSTDISTSATAYMGNIIAMNGTSRANTDCSPHTGVQD